MKTSNFPGVDPFVEFQCLWPDFHATFINYWREAIADRLPGAYEARVGERVQLLARVDGEDRVRRIGPDVSVSRGQGPLGGRAGGTATLEPVPVRLARSDETRETFIQILHRPDRKLVAILELLSPANKEEPGRSQYLAKRESILVQDVHLFELDLLLGGKRLPFDDPLPAGECYAMVARAERRPVCDVYAWAMRDPLPALPIPLAVPDPDVTVDLAEVYRTTFERGRYATSIDYARAVPESAGENTGEWIRGRAKIPG